MCASAAAAGSITDSPQRPHREIQEIAAALGVTIPDTPHAEQTLFEHVFTLYTRGETVQAPIERVITLVDHLGRTILHRVVDEGETSSARRIIDQMDSQKIMFGFGDHKGNTALHLAARAGNLDLIAKLLEHIKIEMRNDEGHTPLHSAVLTGQSDALTMLIDNGANYTDTVTWNGLELSPLALAAIVGDQNCIKVLLKKAKLADANHPAIGNILHLLAHFQQNLSLRYLLRECQQQLATLIEAKNSEHLTPLLVAVKENNPEAVIALRSAGADLNARGRGKTTAMHIAAQLGLSDMLKYLVHLGARLDLLDDQDCLPLQVAHRTVEPLLSNLSRQGKQEEEDLPDFGFRPPENLVFKGGGPKGIAYIGALKHVDLTSVKRVAGTSAGAITSTLLAVGYGVEEIEQLLSKTNLIDWFDCSDEMMRVMQETRLLEGKDVDPRAFFQAAARSYASADTQALLEGAGILGENPFNSKKFFSALAKNVTVERTLDALKLIWRGVQGAESAADAAKGVAREVGSAVQRTLSPLLNCTGLCSGDVFQEWIEKRICEKTGIDHCTFGELHGRTRSPGNFKALHIYATRLGPPQEIVHFSTDAPEFKDVVISSAVRASMSIPGAFVPAILQIKYAGRPTPWTEGGRFADGGMLYNFPLETFDPKGYVDNLPSPLANLTPSYNKRTLGFSLFSPQSEEQPVQKEPETLGELLKAILGTYQNAEGLIRDLNPMHKHRIVEISNEGVGLLDFNLSDSAKQLLITSGERAIRSFLERHNRTERASLFRMPRVRMSLEGTISAPSFHPHYVPRQDLLDRLKRALLDQSASERRSLQVLHGSGGIGKSELAIAFANTFPEHFSLIWFIPSESDENRERAYRELASSLKIYIDSSDNLEVICNKVHRKLESHTGKPWLLIYDNVVEEIPYPSKRGAVIMTSRSTRLFPRTDGFAVPAMTPPVAHALIQKITGDEDGGAIAKLAKRLSYYPLVLGQAAGYIATTPTTNCAKYLEQLEGVVDFDRMKTNTRYEDTLEGVVRVGFSTLPPLAREWLSICAYLNPDEIPLSFLDTYLDNGDCQLDKARRTRMAEEISGLLVDQGLANFDPEKETFTIHRMFQEAIQQLDQDGLLQAVRVVTLAGKEIDLKAHQDWTALIAQGNGWATHAKALRESPLFSDVDKTLQADLLVRIADWSGHTGNPALKLSLLEQASILYVEIFGKRSSKVAMCLNNIGLALNAQGKRDEAIAKLEEAKDIYSEAYGEKHPDVARCLNNIGFALNAQGKRDEAIAKFEEAKDIYSEAYDEKHPDVAMCLNNIGIALDAQGKRDEAIAKLEKAKDIYSEAYGEKHPEVARCLNNIGVALNAQGKRDEAIAKLEKAKDIYSEAYGEKHPDVARCLNNIGLALNAQGKRDEAIAKFEKAKDIYSEAYGEKHPDVAMCLNNIGIALNAQGKRDEAIAKFEEAKDIYSEAYGEKHPEVARCLHNIGVALQNQGKRDEAIAMYEEAIAIYEGLEGDFQSEIAYAQKNIASAKRACAIM